MPHSGTAGGRAPLSEDYSLRNAWMVLRLVATLFEPETNLIFHGKSLRGSAHELRFERKGVGLKWHGEMQLGVDEAPNESLGVALNPKNRKLNGVHESVKQAALGDLLVEHDHIEESERVHVRELGKVDKAQGLRFRVKGRVGDAISVEFCNPDLLEQVRRKIRPHEGFLVSVERGGGREIAFALPL